MSLKFSGFEWDKGNEGKNRLKHGVSCKEAEEAALGKTFIYPDSVHSTKGEERYVLFGETHEKRPLFIAFTLRNTRMRIISARTMSEKERAFYAKQKDQESL